MNAYIIHYNGKYGICFAVEYGRDVFEAISHFMELRKLSQICAVRRLRNGHFKSPALL